MPDAHAEMQHALREGPSDSGGLTKGKVDLLSYYSLGFQRKMPTGREYVYLAGPIAGCSYDEAMSWRDEIQEDFLPGIVGVSPMRLKEWCARTPQIADIDQYRTITSQEEFLLTGESHAIKARDYHDVSRCDMIVAYLPKSSTERRPSWGTAIEMGWASDMCKPIVLVTDDESLAAHPLVRESVGWRRISARSRRMAAPATP